VKWLMYMTFNVSLKLVKTRGGVLFEDEKLTSM